MTAREMVARNVARVRELRDRSQAGLARQLGWTPPTLWKLEHGQRAISVDELLSLALALNVAPVVLLTPWEDEEALTVTVAGTGLELQMEGNEAFGWMVGAPTPELLPLIGNAVDYFRLHTETLRRKAGLRLLDVLRREQGWDIDPDGRSVTRPSGLTVRWGPKED